MSNNERDVLILIKCKKKGYIVSAAGTEEMYPCMSTEDITEAIQEILDNPDIAIQAEPAIEEEEKPKASKRRAAKVEDEGVEGEDEAAAAGPRFPGGFDTDELLINGASAFLNKLRGMSATDLERENARRAERNNGKR